MRRGPDYKLFEFFSLHREEVIALKAIPCIFVSKFTPSETDSLINKYRRTFVLWLLFCVFFVLSGARVTHGQAEEGKFEVGGHVSVLSVPTRTVTVNSTGVNAITDRRFVAGFGGRFGYNVTKHVTLEAEFDVFPRDNQLDGGRKFQALFGPKIGRRFEKVGIFANARPGFVRFSKGDLELIPGALCGAQSPPPITCFSPASTTNFAINLGGVLELYPSKRTIIRFDAGDTIVRLGSRTAAAVEIPPPGTFVPVRIVGVPVGAGTSHNLQLSAGFAVRF